MLVSCQYCVSGTLELVKKITNIVKNSVSYLLKNTKER